MQRLHYLDNLKILLSILVVLHHVGTGFGTMGGWCYVTTDPMQGSPQIFFSALFGIEATFSMSLFFFISGYLTPRSLDKKGTGKFLQTQLLRLGIPLLFVMTIFAPTILYLIELYRGSTEIAWLEYILVQNLYYPNTSHAWFILVLIFFDVVYSLYWKYFRHRVRLSEFINSFPNRFRIAVFILVCSCLTLALRQVYPIGKNFIGLQFANFVPYVFMYSAGILVYRKGWLDQLTDAVASFWFYVSVPFILLFGAAIYLVMTDPPYIDNFINGLHPEAILLAFMETIVCIGLSGFLLYQFRKFFNYSNPALTKLSANRYGVYIFHSGIVVGVTVVFEFIPLTPQVKFPLACIASVFFSFLFVSLIRNISLVRRIL